MTAALALGAVGGSAGAQGAAGAPLRYTGVNLSSAEYNADKLPGEAGKDYVYPGTGTAAPFLAAGMNAVRVPVLWERLQPQPMGPLDPAELGRLDTAVRELGAFQLFVIDIHNYARYRGKLLAADDRSLTDLWHRLAEHYRGNDRVAFGLMNEPHDISALDWRAIAERSVAAIRSAGARNLVLVPGTSWSGGHSWTIGNEGSNAAAFAGFRDPGNRFAFDIHQYLDADSSGTKKECAGAKVGRERLAAVTAWMRREHAVGWLGEFGASSEPTCLAALGDMLQYMQSNGDAWLGWTYWAGGDWWGSYPLSIQPEGGRDKPQMGVLKRYLKGAAAR
ncbi:glycoside hydrolase family 5 protein [Sphingomonas ginkgonis]|uniref:Glycoside hydrolase family 5 protein n=2 Tax=Sphingomonas ginkgonis TaxID=2315330 RepID=A0A429VEB3_9SPHN|nr:glycoside hydrolase family 5 protein [Sphingomonas ginkgonis]